MDSKKTVGFCKDSLAWNFEFVHWSGKQVAAKLVTNVDFTKLSPDTFKKQFHNGATISVYDYNEKPEKEGKPNLQFGIAIPYGLSEKRDPHAIFTANEVKLLTSTMIREAQVEFIRKIAFGWFYEAVKYARADKFDLEYVNELEDLTFKPLETPSPEPGASEE